MRFTGRIKTWNDERGFGFIEPTQGGQELFVHIKAFRDRRERPVIGQHVTFEVEADARGKKRALHVEALRKGVTGSGALRVHAKNQTAAAWGGASLFAVPAFLVVLVLGHLFGRPPRWVVWVYLGLSVLTFMAYAIDKSAARRGAWRVSERTLHIWSLAGGWPGAILAQQFLRHKSAKAEFRLVFWCTVLVNIMLFGILASSNGQALAGLWEHAVRFYEAF